MKKTKILLVEDEKIVAIDIKNALVNLGYDVAGLSSSGENALKKIEETQPDLVLMDIVLKGDMNGIEASDLVRKRFNIPVIYMTAYADDKTLEKAKITEPFGYILKPVEERELRTSIEMALYKHKMESLLREREEQYRLIFETAANLIISVDRKGTILDCNNRIAQFLGYKPDDIISQSINKIIHPDSIKKIRAASKEITSKGFSYNKECKMVKKRGRIIDVNINSSALKDEKGKHTGTIYIVNDITERKKMEGEKERLQAQLIHSEKMAGIGTLAGGIAHEFNNLLQIMSGIIQFSQKTKKPEDIEEAFHTVINTSNRAAKIIRNLLTFSAQESPAKETCLITEPIESVLSLIETPLQKQNIKIIRKYEEISPIEINKTDIQQVFFNLIINARDAMLPKGGKLEIGVKEADGYLEVKFHDTGKGIEKKNLEKVFEPFYTTKGAYGGSNIPGTGLGLSVSYGLTKRHGGTIEVESKVNKGTTFTLKLPMKSEELNKGRIKSQKEKEIKKSKPLNILVVDDEEKICQTLTRYLLSEGHRAKSVSTGEKAVEVIKNENFHLVLLDLIMPGISGINILEKIKNISSKTKVIMITGKLMDKNLLKELKQKGAHGYIQKPFQIKDIIEINNFMGTNMSL